MNKLEYLQHLGQIVYHNIIVETEIIGFKLRFTLIDGSFIDVYLPAKESSGFAFHWEHRHIDKLFYRYDNYPDIKWRNIKTFPYHFHNGRQDKVIAAHFDKEVIEGFKDFMDFVRSKLKIK
ncbi:MAG: DUF6516 family protein [Candidatus Firestonebacteria bacterium]